MLDCLRGNSWALCIADTDDSPYSDVTSTTAWGYERLRREGYTDECLGQWIEKLRSQARGEAYIFFKHEETGTGPKLAARYLELAAS